MRFLLRVLLLIVLCSYLSRRYKGFRGETFRHMHSAEGGETPKGLALAQISDDHFRSGLAQANLPPGVLPRHDLTPGAIDPHTTQSNIRNTICRLGYATSLMDYLFRWMELKFLKNEQGELFESRPVSNRDTPPRNGRGAVESLGDLVQFGDAPACNFCGSLMVRSGTCFRCGTCGSTSGCS